jgi:hypothetical protein
VRRGIRLAVSAVVIVLLLAAWLRSDAFPTVLGINFVAYMFLMGIGGVLALNGFFKDTR